MDALSAQTPGQPQTTQTQSKAQFNRDWFPIVLGWCRSRGGTKIDPQDVAQDVCIIALRKLDGLSDPSKLGAWLFGVTRRVLKDHRMRAWNRRWSGTSPTEACDLALSPEERYAQAEAKEAVQGIIRELPSRQREVVALCLIERHSLSEASQLLRVPQGTVASRLRLARKKIQRAARCRQLC